MIRILVVDDQNIVRQGIQAILAAKPEFEVVGTANDGKSAIKLAASLKPDVLIMDIEMPKMNGIMATKKICQQFPEIKVLVLSSHENQEYLVQALQAGAYGYLLKDTLAKNLEQAIWSVYQSYSQIETTLLKPKLSEAIPIQTKIPIEQNGSNLTKKQSDNNLAAQSEPEISENLIKNPNQITDDHHFSQEKAIFSHAQNFWLIILGILALLVTTGTIFYGLNLTNRPTTTIATQETTEPVNDAITALGRIEPEGEVITLSPPPNMGGAKIAELMVREGEQVIKGQVIALLDNHQFKKTAVESAQQQVEVAQVNLEIVKAGAKTGDIEAQAAVIDRLEADLVGKIKTQSANITRLKAQLNRETEAQAANLRRSQAELKNAMTEFQRYQQLAQDGAISRSELDSHRLTLETSQEKVREAQANYDRTQDTLREEIKEAQSNTESSQNTIKQQIKEAQASLASIAEVRPLDVQKAAAELRKAIADLQQAKADLELTYVRAPVASQVLRINTHPGEMVIQNEGVVELGQTEKMVVIAEIYESDIEQVSLGQTAEIMSEGGVFEEQIQGQVTHIRSQIGKKDIFDTDPMADVDTRVIEVKITLDSASSQKVSQFTNSKVIVKIKQSE